MNSCLMFKKAFRSFLLILSVICVCISFCSCKSESVYRIDSMNWISNEGASIITEYTYTSDNKPESISVTYPSGFMENYQDVFTYNKKGDMVSCERTYLGTHNEVYTAKKITDNKYILYDASSAEFLTLIFDDSGFIVSYRYAIGHTTEYSFTYDKSGKPLAFKQLDIHPSGSRRIVDYTVEFTEKDTFRMYATGEYENPDEYYEVKYQKISLKG